MATRYFVWKDPGCFPTSGWQELTKAEFASHREEFRAAGRLFIRMGALSPGEDVYILEATRAQYAAWNREKLRKRRHARQAQAHPRMILRMDDLPPAERRRILELEDESELTKIEDGVLLDEMARCRRRLPAEDQRLLVMLYEEELSGREAARLCGVTPSAVSHRVQRLLTRMRKELV